MSDSEWEAYWQMQPPSKLELIDGRLIVGDSLNGSRVLLQNIIDGWGLTESLTQVPLELFWPAMRQAFSKFDPPPLGKPTSVWESWSRQVSYSISLPPAGPKQHGSHHATVTDLAMGLFSVRESLGRSLSRDCVVKLGEDGFTPDVFFYRYASADRQFDYYFDGPPDWIIEVILPGHEQQDTEFKRTRYEAAGVGEYWILDPDKQQHTFLRLSDGRYTSVNPEGDRISPAFEPRIGLRLDRLRDTKSHHRDLFETRDTEPEGTSLQESPKGPWTYGSLAFRPQIGIDPNPISFGEFISWSPRAKFEMIEGKPLIDGTIGTRNVLGMLLQTLGLADALSLFPPEKWVKARLALDGLIESNPKLLAEGQSQARKASTFLRLTEGIGRAVLIGDYASSRTIGPWSFIDVVHFDEIETHWYELHEKMKSAGISSHVEFRHFDRLTDAAKAEIETGIEL